MIVICPVSATGNIQVIGVPGAVYTTPAAFPALTKSAIINEFETQSQADPTGFHVNVKEVNGTAQTANDNGADINEILSDTGSTLDTLIKDIPTVAEFEARSILAANYLLVSDTIAGVTAVTNDVGITQAGADKVWSTAARALTDKAGFALSAAGIDAIIDEVIEGTITLRQAQRIFLAILAGKSAGGGTVTLTFRDNADAKNRISATVDSSGNRTAMILDGA